VAASAIYVAAMTVVMTTAGSPLPELSRLFVLQQLAALATASCAMYAAFASAVPDARSSWRVPLLAAGGAWLLLLTIGAVRDVQSLGTLGVGVESDWPCVLSITVGGAVLGLPAYAALRRGVALTPRRMALLLGIAALGAANLAACLTRPHTYTSTILIWHGAILIIGAAMLTVMSRRLFRWPPHAP
jgi:hypothetical protein